jgi:hypothetical protein
VSPAKKRRLVGDTKVQLHHNVLSKDQGERPERCCAGVQIKSTVPASSDDNVMPSHQSNSVICSSLMPTPRPSMTDLTFKPQNTRKLPFCFAFSLLNVSESRWS